MLRNDKLYIESDFDLRVYSDEIITWVKLSYDIEEVFDKSDLEAWALDNGFIKDEN